MKHLKQLWYWSVLPLCCTNGFAQDSLKAQAMTEIVVIQPSKPQTLKPLSSLDAYLEQFKNLSLIKRGAYAWEPLINSMPTERSSITLDGMHIFNACTDKMDPMTSYIEINNLAAVHLVSGQQGSQHGPTIGGGLNLVSKKGHFSEQADWSGGLQSGYDSNNRQKTIGGNLQYSAARWYTTHSLLFREADNYSAGGNREVLYSSYRKLNASSTVGYAIRPQQRIEAAVIYDKATDVGYPALPMDVSLAEAVIASVKFENHFEQGPFEHWETKLYYNSITHRMDDSQRPDVPIRMDMPGWSSTYGLYSKLTGSSDKHRWTAQWNAYQNTSLAEMTMYPQNPSEVPMFMYTWPDVRTNYNGLYLQDQYAINTRHRLLISASIGQQSSQIQNDVALESLRIFYPDMAQRKNRFLGNVAINLHYQNQNWTTGTGLAYGLRAPSVSEAYGFYLFHSADRYDYIGNPELKNEKSLEFNAYIGWENRAWKSKISASFFHLSDYIAGKPTAFIPMTIGADGVKRYVGLDFAQIASAQWTLAYQWTPRWRMSAALSYHYGKDSDQNNLPFISPIRYSGSLEYKDQRLNAALILEGNALKTQFAAAYGEAQTAAYAVANLLVGYAFNWNQQRLQLQTGVENILDTHYTTFADWNQLPRQGRNLFVNLSYAF
ncbi:TonB-dependent receptor [Flavobacterium sp. JP2137]|uniref:TonB-dependent receptor n=1 Tax=Flavobacterium sp. JP2137 TaxID=3414510 RepID=UPI003D2FE3F1